MPDHAPREDQHLPSPDPVGVVAAQLVAFLDAIATRQPPGPGLIDGGVAPLRILDAARRSAREGRAIDLP
jgi:predicted dehydrogenase